MKLLQQLISLCLMTTAFSQRQQDINLRYKSNVTLDCAGLDSSDVEFYRRDSVESEDGSISHNETLLVENKKTKVTDSKMSIDDLRAEDIRGVSYFCQSAGDASNKIEFNSHIEPYIYKPEKASQTVTEGGNADLQCNVLYGLEDLSVPLTWTWRKNGSVVEESDRYTIESSANETRLLISGVTELDKGAFACVLSNANGEHSEEIILRVKDMLAALWPFLGIVAEVVLLCAIILIYEKKCSAKPNRQNSAYDNEQNQNLMGNKNLNSDIKKRNARA